MKAKVRKPAAPQKGIGAAESAQADNPKQAPKGGPDAKVPDAKPAAPKIAKPGKGETDPATTLTGPAISLRKGLKNNLQDAEIPRKGFDQGFEKKKLDQAAGEAAQANSGNPVDALTGGGIGGVLGGAANSQSGSTGIVGQGKGAITSEGGPLTSGGSALFKDGEVQGGSADAALEKAAELTGKSKAEVNKAVTDILGLTGNSTRAQMLEASKDDGFACPRPRRRAHRHF